MNLSNGSEFICQCYRRRSSQIHKKQNKFKRFNLYCRVMFWENKENYSISDICFNGLYRVHRFQKNALIKYYFFFFFLHQRTMIYSKMIQLTYQGLWHSWLVQVDVWVYLPKTQFFLIKRDGENILLHKLSTKMIKKRFTWIIYTCTFSSPRRVVHSVAHLPIGHGFSVHNRPESFLKIGILHKLSPKEVLKVMIVTDRGSFEWYHIEALYHAGIRTIKIHIVLASVHRISVVMSREVWIKQQFVHLDNKLCINSRQCCGKLLRYIVLSHSQ